MTARSNVLVSQLGEYLACAELNRRGYIATPFSKNVPEIDLLVFDEELRAIPLQVKAFTHAALAGTATTYMDVTITPDGRQFVRKKRQISNPDLIYIYIEIGIKYGEDEFFLLRKRDVFEIQYQNYRGWLKKHSNRRPKKPTSLHCALYRKNLEPYRDNWGILAT